jgi:hypothetical protein
VIPSPSSGVGVGLAPVKHIQGVIRKYKHQGESPGYLFFRIEIIRKELQELKILIL